MPRDVAHERVHLVLRGRGSGLRRGAHVGGHVGVEERGEVDVLLHGHHDGRLVAVGGQAVRLHADAHRPPAAFHAAGHAELAREGARFRRGIAPRRFVARIDAGAVIGARDVRSLERSNALRCLEGETAGVVERGSHGLAVRKRAPYAVRGTREEQ